MACRLDGVKLVSEPVLCYVNLTLENKLQWNFNQNTNFSFTKMHLKYRLRKGGNFVQGEMNWTTPRHIKARIVWIFLELHCTSLESLTVVASERFQIRCKQDPRNKWMTVPRRCLYKYLYSIMSLAALLHVIKLSAKVTTGKLYKNTGDW